VVIEGVATVVTVVCSAFTSVKLVTTASKVMGKRPCGFVLVVLVQPFVLSEILKI
jgi:hypothetical protein